MNAAVLFSVAWMVGGCVHAPVDVSLRAVVVGPADWDGAGSAAPVIQASALDAMRSVDPLVAAMGAQLANSALAAFAPPDVRGAAVVLRNGGGSGSSAVIPEVSNSFAPTWPRGKVLLRGVPMDRGTAIEVTLVDADLLNDDDPIARVLLSHGQLKRALRAKAPTWFDFEEATDGRLLRLAVEVGEE